MHGQSESSIYTVEDVAFDSEYFKQYFPNYKAQTPPKKLRHYAQVVERFRPPELPKRIHDMGCAFGMFLDQLGPEWERYGSDVSEYAIDVARSTVDGVTFAAADSRTSPFDGKFSVVTAFDMLEHHPELDSLAAAAHEQLSPGGVFVFVVPVYDGLSGPAIRLLDKDPTHIHRWKRKRWIEWVASAGFEVLHWEGILRYLFMGRFYLYRRTRFWRGHTPAIAVAARRVER